MKEPGARVSLHQQVNVFLGLIEAGEARLLQGLLDLLSGVVVNIDLEETKRKHTVNCVEYFGTFTPNISPRKQTVLQECDSNNYKTKPYTQEFMSVRREMLASDFFS